MMAGAVAWLRADPRRFDLALAAAISLVGAALFLGTPDRFDTGWPEVVAGVGAFVLIALRRHHPLVLLTVAMMSSAVHLVVWGRPTPMVIAILVLLATACIRLDRWPAVALGAVVAAFLYVAGAVANDAELGDARAVIGVAWSAGAVGVADATRSWRRYQASADAQVQSALLAAESEARRRVSEERLVIARELHDLLAHHLSVMNVQTGAALHLLRTDPDRAEASLTVARDAGRTVLDELRELLAVLRHDGDEEPPTSSLPSVDEIDDLVDTMRATGLDVTWHRTGVPRAMAPAASLAAYRLVQEGLTNAARHGDGHADLTTAWDGDGFAIRIDNRRGGHQDAGGAGLGLIGMRERALANGGRVTARPDGDHFVVEAWLPITGGAEVEG